jgi:hypothetical protein
LNSLERIYDQLGIIGYTTETTEITQIIN